ncbi:MAG TPA: cell division protein ZapA [Leucothrix mucor]|nr:cell division protein ZapA [Leucothrix mucor]
MSDDKTKKSIPISIRILDKDYMVACPSGEQKSLISSARQVDEKMRDIRKSGKIIGSERIAVITALNLAHELNTASGQVQFIDQEIVSRVDELQQRIDATLARINPSIE